MYALLDDASRFQLHPLQHGSGRSIHRSVQCGILVQLQYFLQLVVRQLFTVVTQFVSLDKVLIICVTFAIVLTKLPFTIHFESYVVGIIKDSFVFIIHDCVKV